MLTNPIRHKMDHTQVNVLQVKTSELELDFVEYIQYTNVRIADLFRPPPYTIYRVTSYVRLLAWSILTCNPNMSFLAGFPVEVPISMTEDIDKWRK